MNFNATHYKEHQKEYFNHKLFSKKIFLDFFIHVYENYTLSIDFYVKLMRSYLSILK